jgi:hypothetical protein
MRTNIIAFTIPWLVLASDREGRDWPEVCRVIENCKNGGKRKLRVAYVIRSLDWYYLESHIPNQSNGQCKWWESMGKTSETWPSERRFVWRIQTLREGRYASVLILMKSTLSASNFILHFSLQGKRGVKSDATRLGASNGWRPCTKANEWALVVFIFLSCLFMPLIQFWKWINHTKEWTIAKSCFVVCGLLSDSVGPREGQ